MVAVFRWTSESEPEYHTGQLISTRRRNRAAGRNMLGPNAPDGDFNGVVGAFSVSLNGFMNP